MNAFKYSLLLASAAFVLPSAFALPSLANSSTNSSAVNPLSVKIVQQQFINAKIVPNEVAVFDPIGLLQVDFKTVGVTTVGKAIAKANVQSQPSLKATGNFNWTSSKYTVLMVDANYAGSSNPNGIYLHWLQNDATVDRKGGIVTSSTRPVIPYYGPAPPTGTGPHRYTLLLFAQPTNFTPPSHPAPNFGPHRVNLINLAKYIASAKLGTPLVGSYFTVEVGKATVKVSPTEAVNPASLNANSTTSRSAKSTSTITTSSSSSSSKTSPGSSPSKKGNATAKVSPTTTVNRALVSASLTTSHSAPNTTTTSSTSSPSQKTNSAGKGGVTIGAVLLSAFGIAVVLV